MTRRTAMLMLPVIAVAALTVAVARREPGWALAGSPGALALEVSAGLALALAGLVIQARGPDARSGALLYATAIAWLVAEWNSPGALGAVVFTLGMVFAYTASALAAHALLVHGIGRLGSLAARVAVAAGYVGLAGLAGVAATAAREPSEAGCSTCPANLLAVTNAPETARWLERWGLRIGIAALATVVLLSALRVWRASPVARRTAVPVLVPTVAFLAIVAAQQVHDLGRGWEGFGHVDETLRLAEGLALIAVALGVVWQRFATRRMRHRLARLVLDLADAVRPGELRALMATALDDPTLELLFAFEGGWVDAAGVSKALPSSDERGQTALVQEGEVVAVVIHTRGLLDDARLVEELGRAARLAVDHERLQAQQRANSRGCGRRERPRSPPRMPSAGDSNGTFTTARSRPWPRSPWRSAWLEVHARIRERTGWPSHRLMSARRSTGCEPLPMPPIPPRLTRPGSLRRSTCSVTGGHRSSWWASPRRVSITNSRRTCTSSSPHSVAAPKVPSLT